MAEERKPNSPEDYFEQLEEWQRHQYDPGYYTGGRPRPLFSRGRLPKMYGWMLVMGSGIYLVLMIAATVMSYLEHTLTNVIGLLPVGGVAVLLFLIGLRMVRSGNQR